MVHWSCSSVLCYNNHKSVDSNGNKVNKYRLPTNKDVQLQYMKFFKTTKTFNWVAGYICAEHWSSGVRITPSDLPDLLLPPGHFDLLEKKYKRARATFKAAAKPTKQQRNTYTKAKAKYNAALSSFQSVSTISRNPINRETSFISASSTLSISNDDLFDVAHQLESTGVDSDVDSDKNDSVEIAELKRQLLEKDSKIRKLEETIHLKNRKIDMLKLEVLDKKTFSFEKISATPDKFQYLTGLSVGQFKVLMDCVRPFIEICLLYDGNRKATEHTFDYATQYLIVLMICRHGLDFKFAAHMTNVSDVTIGRIFNGWVTFLSTLFDELDTRPHQKFLAKKMPKIFKETGHGTTDLVLDATEFKFDTASNFDINTLMFSHYKNHATGKALIGISAHGMGVIFSEVYPGSISDTEITEKTQVLNYVTEGHEIMTDRGFSIQDLCAIKGVSLNRPKQKDSESNQFTQGEIHKNFDIAATRIHVERYIGRVRDWRILNNIWPLNRVDMLTSTWKMVCHTVNLVFPPIGPRIEPQ